MLFLNDFYFFLSHLYMSSNSFKVSKPIRTLLTEWILGLPNEVCFTLLVTIYTGQTLKVNLES